MSRLHRTTIKRSDSRTLMIPNASENSQHGLPNTQRYATATLVAVAVFVVVSAALDVFEPDYSPVSQTLSDHLNNSVRWWGFIALSSAGLACLATAGAARSALASPVSTKLSVRLLVAAGISFVTASIFPANPDKTDTWGNISTGIHVACAAIAFISALVAINKLSTYLNKTEQLGGNYRALLWIARASPAMLLLFPVGARLDSVGIAQRIFFGFIFGWLVLFAVGIRSRQFTARVPEDVEGRTITSGSKR